MRTIEDVLEHHGIQATRSGHIRCPWHDDTNPSCQITNGFAYCHSCGNNGDAAGLEAALSGRTVGQVLHDWGDGNGDMRRPSALKAVDAHSMRRDAWLGWVTDSQAVLDRVLEADPDGYMAFVDGAAEIFDMAVDYAHPRKGDEAFSPAVVRVGLQGLLEDLREEAKTWLK